MSQDAAVAPAEEITTDIVQRKAPRSLLGCASKELEAVIERVELLGNGMSEVRDRPICEAGLRVIARLDVDSSLTLFGLIVGKEEKEMWRHRILVPILIGVTDGLRLPDTIAFNG